jgi:hypothetical protein
LKHRISFFKVETFVAQYDRRANFRLVIPLEVVCPNGETALPKVKAGICNIRKELCVRIMTGPGTRCCHLRGAYFNAGALLNLGRRPKWLARLTV